MRKVGIILIGFGLALLIFALINYIKEKNQIVSPLPEKENVKVIFLSPTK